LRLRALALSTLNPLAMIIDPILTLELAIAILLLAPADAPNNANEVMIATLGSVIFESPNVVPSLNFYNSLTSGQLVDERCML